MREKVINRITAILLISVLVLWNLSPIISYAGSFMTPGQPMTPGNFYKPGKPITGGTFMIPGEFYKPGKPVEGGKIGSVSSQAIVQNPIYNNPIFVKPTMPTPPAPGLFWQSKLFAYDGKFPEGSTIATDYQKPGEGQIQTGDPKLETVNDIHGAAKQAKKYLVTFPKRFGEILDGTLSIAAGFKIKDLKTATGNKNLYQILGRTTFTNANNPVAMWLNLRYQNYLESFNDKKLILRNNTLRSGTEVKAKKIAPFFQSNIGFKTALKKIGKDFSDNWNPFSNPFNPANKGIGKVVNKEFFKFSKVAKGSGLGNVLLSTGGRIINYATDSKKHFKSTDFAAGITTDVAFGVGSTAVSAAAGSVVPGVGTIVGAVVGIGIALLLETKVGRRFKGAVEKGIKKVYDGAINLGKKLGSSMKAKISGLFG
ncbi:hypothetical protein ACNQFZ_09720 [Schinkia sp. CFF1]